MSSNQPIPNTSPSQHPTTTSNQPPSSSRQSPPPHPIFSAFDSSITNDLTTTRSSTVIKRAQNNFDSFITHSLWFSPLIDTTKSLLAFLPGRFSTTNISGEVLYALLTLLGQYNDKVLGKAVNNQYSIHYYGESVSRRKSTKSSSTSRDNTAGLNNCTPRSMHMGGHKLNWMNIQATEPRLVRRINTALHCFSIFESLLEQLSGQAFLTMTSTYQTNLHQKIQERSNYLTMLLLQNTKDNELTSQLGTNSPPQIQPSTVSNGANGKIEVTSPISKTIVQGQLQLKRQPHSFNSYKDDSATSQLQDAPRQPSDQTSSFLDFLPSFSSAPSQPQPTTPHALPEQDLAQLSPIERLLVEKQDQSDDKTILERYSNPQFQSLLSHFFSTDTLFQYLAQLDARFMMRMYQFKMFTVAGVEGIKFLLRMVMLYLNSGKMLINKSMTEINIEQLQFMNGSEYKRYATDQLNLNDYIRNMKQFQKDKQTTMRLILEQQELANKNKATTPFSPKDMKQEKDESTEQIQKSDFQIQLPTKPSAPTPSSAFSSSLTSTPFRPLKYNPNQKNPIQTSPFATFLSFPCQSTSQPQQSNDTTTTTTSTDQTTPAQPITFTDTLLNNTPIQYNNALHKQCIQNPYEKVPDLDIVKSLKQLYFQRHRGVVAHGQHTFSLIQTFFQHYYHFQHNPDQPSTNNDDLSPNELNILSSISPHHTFIDYILSIFKINPISPHLHNLNSHSNQSQTTQIATSTQAISDLQTVGDIHQPDDLALIQFEAETDNPSTQPPAITPTQQLHLISTLSNALPTKAPVNHVVSEVLYWMRPVVYTLLSALCNQPALLTFLPSIMTNLTSMPADPVYARLMKGTQPQQRPQPSSLLSKLTSIVPIFSSFHSAFSPQGRSTNWYDNLIISTDLSQPSIVPTIASLLIDFAAFYLSPAWDAQSTMKNLSQNQLNEYRDLLQLVKKEIAKNKEKELLYKAKQAAAAATAAVVVAAKAGKKDGADSTNDAQNNAQKLAEKMDQVNKVINSWSDDKISQQLHPISSILLQNQHQEQTALLQTQLMTWKQRQGNYWLYIFRPPFLTFVLLKPLSWLADKLQNVPLIGGFLQLVVALLKIFQHHYFYASGS